VILYSKERVGKADTLARNVCTFLAETIFCAQAHKKLPVGKKIAAITKAPQGLSISEFSACERAKLVHTI
jgi:hypothetical protein